MRSTPFFKMIKANTFLCWCWCCILMTGCAGYQLGEVKPKSLKNISNIAVETFHNETLYPRVEALAATAVIKQLELDGTYRIISRNAVELLHPKLNPTKAKKTTAVILNGTVKRVIRTPARAVNGNVLLTSEFTLSTSIAYELINPEDGTIIRRGEVTGSTNFFISGDLVQDERQAMPLALEQAASRLVGQISEGF